MADTGSPRICLLTTPETSASLLYGLFDVLTTAGAIVPEMLQGAPGHQLFDVRIVAAAAAPFRCYGNVLIEPAAGISDIDRTDVAIVCDMYQPINQPPHGRYRDEIEWLKRIYQGGTILASVCTGSLMLAEAGLLDGLEAACHWAYRDMFRDHYPSVKLRDNSILCFAGENNRIVTAGGTMSWQDLSLYLITHFGGHKQAVLTAKAFLMADRSDGQRSFAIMAPRTQKSDRLIADSQAWIAENYTCENPVAQMANRAGLTSRTFARRFRASTGYEPMDYVQSLRIEEAKQMLETMDISVEDVGHAVGYEDPTSFRRLFKRKAGLTPAAYRRKFAKLVLSQLMPVHRRATGIKQTLHR
jgi:transcriptional regulator GlxA family with amidase domain